MTDCTIKYSFNNETYETMQEVENAINEITEPKTVKITYKVSYKPEDEVKTTSVTRSITLK